MKTRSLVLAVMACGCLITSSCQKQRVSPPSSGLSKVHMTTVDFENAKAKFNASPGFRTKEARILAPMITQGMTKDQVRDILGEPDKKGALQSLDSVWNYSVFYSQVITVTFENDRVMKTEATGIE